MTGECPHLEYRTDGDGMSFGVARAFCTVTDSFVQPMRADVCNARYDLDPAADCEFYVNPDATSTDRTPQQPDGAPEPTDGATEQANGSPEPTDGQTGGGDTDR